MLIDDIAKEMTQEQFINHLKKDISVSFVYNGKSYACPNQIGLEDVGYIETDCEIGCNHCWLLASKDVDFRDKNKKGGELY